MSPTRDTDGQSGETATSVAVDLESTVDGSCERDRFTRSGEREVGGSMEDWEHYY